MKKNIKTKLKTIEINFYDLKKNDLVYVQTNNFKCNCFWKVIDHDWDMALQKCYYLTLLQRDKNNICDHSYSDLLNLYENHNPVIKRISLK
jgi:hypothetical protein